MSGTQTIGRIGVLMGGCSSEREISLKSGHAVHAALQAAGQDSVAIDVSTTDETEVLRTVKEHGVDLAFIALHGAYGEDGTLQEQLERGGIVYSGCGPEASRKAMNKAVAQKIWKENGLLVPDYAVLEKPEDRLPGGEGLDKFPVVVKPASEGSSMGVSIVRSREELAPALEKAFRFGTPVLTERFIRGREVTVGIVGNEALPVVEIRPLSGFFDFEAKYQKGRTEYLVPAPIDGSAARALQETALAAFKSLGGRDLSRVDFILEEGTQKPFLLEMNTIPGFTQTSLLPMAAAKRGYSFSQLCVLIAGLAAGRRKNR